MTTTPRKKTAAYRLFHFRYTMEIPQMYMFGKDYIKKNGYHVSGDSGVDQLRLTATTRVRQTPAALAMFHAEGCPIKLVNIQDAVPIYEDIQEHLRDWERMATQGIHPADAPPIEDFRQLEAVAMELYPIAKHFEPKETGSGELRDRIMNMNRLRNPGRTEQILRKHITDDKGNLKPYVSIVDRIEKLIIEGCKQWL